MVSTASLVVMVINMIFGVALPVFLLLWFKKRHNASIKAFLFGLLTMFVFAFILESIMHSIVLSTGLGQSILASTWGYAIYGGLAAGIFEECGRFITMKFFLKKETDNPHNALMYGAGHGGIEMVVLLTMTMFNNLLYSIMINTGHASIITSALDDANKAVLEETFNTLIAYPPAKFLLSSWERVSAMAVQLSLSVLVWIAVTKGAKKIWFLFLAILMHAFLDGMLMPLKAAGLSDVLLEVCVMIVAAVYACIAVFAWKKNLAKEETV
jgi:uncharacterized membrane protein YhfC